MATPAEPFAYEDLMESSIQSVIARNNKFDPTGKANELRIPPRRIQQQLRRPKWYNPEQHAAAPYVSASISAPGTFTPGTPYPVTVTLRHHPNPAGNPAEKPVTFALENTALTDIGRPQLYPWLLLRHDSTAQEGGLKEVDGESEGHGPAEPWEGDEHAPAEPAAVSAENGFVSLAVGESTTFAVVLKAADLVTVGEKYSLCFRGGWVWWWRWGSLEELQGERKVALDRAVVPKMVLAATNSVQFVVEES